MGKASIGVILSRERITKVLIRGWSAPLFANGINRFYRDKAEQCHKNMNQLMRLWYLSHRQPAKARASLRICAVSPEPSLFAHMNYGSRRRVRPKSRYLALLYGCACVFEEWIYGGQKVPKSHELAHMGLKMLWDFIFLRTGMHSLAIGSDLWLFIFGLVS